MASRQGLYNAELQNDLDGKSKNITNVNQIDVVQSGTVYVDAGLATEIGEIDSLMAFKTLEAAIHAAPPGYSIIMRPGTYSYDGILTVNRARTKIIGQGAIISPVTSGDTAGLLITGNYITIDGLTFDGNATGTPSDTGTAIEVNSATNVTLKNLAITDQHGSGITLTDRYSFVDIDNCTISSCYNGIVGGITSANDITGVSITNCSLQSTRAGAISFTGDDNDNFLGDIRIMGNDIINCDTDTSLQPAIGLLSGISDAIVTNNYISQTNNGIKLSQSQRATINSNSFSGIQLIMITLDGSKEISITGNLLDGSNPATGNPLSTVGVYMTGYYTSLNDAGPYSISSNMISGIGNGGKFIHIANANDITISSNQMAANAYVYASAFTHLKVSGNVFTVSGTNPVISLDAAERGWSGCTISDNRFKLTGTRGRLVQTTDASGTGQSNITIVGNWSTQEQNYAQGIYDNVSGSDPVRAFLHSNSPQATDRDGGVPDRRTGWVNDYQTAFISDSINIPTDSAYKYQVGGAQVVGSRITGWALPTGTQTRTTFDPATVTLAALAQRVNALLHDLHITTGHGLIGYYS